MPYPPPPAPLKSENPGSYTEEDKRRNKRETIGLLAFTMGMLILIGIALASGVR